MNWPKDACSGADCVRRGLQEQGQWHFLRQRMHQGEVNRRGGEGGADGPEQFFGERHDGSPCRKGMVGVSMRDKFFSAMTLVFCLDVL